MIVTHMHCMNCKCMPFKCMQLIVQLHEVASAPVVHTQYDSSKCSVCTSVYAVSSVICYAVLLYLLCTRSMIVANVGVTLSSGTVSSSLYPGLLVLVSLSLVLSLLLSLVFLLLLVPTYCPSTTSLKSIAPMHFSTYLLLLLFCVKIV
jgi:hypothetical protein